MTDADLQQELVALERRGWDSLCDSTGGTFYGDVMIEDGLMILANGAVMDRPTVVAALDNAPPWRTYSIDDVRVVTRASPNAVYDAQLATFAESGGLFSQNASPGFIELWTLQSRMAHRVRSADDG